MPLPLPDDLPPVTITRPGDAEAIDVLASEPAAHRRIPTWVKLAAAVAVVVLVAVANEAAARRERRQERLAADRAEVTLLLAGGDVRAGEFELALVVTNRGGPVAVGTPRLVPPSYGVAESVAERIDTGATAHLEVWLRAVCPAGEPLPFQLAVPVTPASGRTRDLLLDVDRSMVADLSGRACDYLTAAEAAQMFVGGVSSSRYSVRFTLTVHNRSDRPFVIADVTSPGLAMGIRDGLPVTVAPTSGLLLHVTGSLPACSRLPSPGPPGRGGAVRFGTITLELLDDSGEPQTTQYVAGAEGGLLTALGALRSRICPGAG
ncbi:MAG: hypothetical protein JJD92_15745 [Frankiaceae bacterium]|nr:hypothetical protein [Frankiaceae bacterium]